MIARSRAPPLRTHAHRLLPIPSGRPYCSGRVSPNTPAAHVGVVSSGIYELVRGPRVGVRATSLSAKRVCISSREFALSVVVEQAIAYRVPLLLAHTRPGGAFCLAERFAGDDRCLQGRRHGAPPTLARLARDRAWRTSRFGSFVNSADNLGEIIRSQPIRTSVLGLADNGRAARAPPAYAGELAHHLPYVASHASPWAARLLGSSMLLTGGHRDRDARP